MFQDLTETISETDLLTFLICIQFLLTLLCTEILCAASL